MPTVEAICIQNMLYQSILMESLMQGKITVEKGEQA